MHCLNCGNPVEEDDLFCGECGYKLRRRFQSVNVAEREISQAKSHEASNNGSQSTQVDENKNVVSQQSDSTMKHSKDENAKHNEQFQNEALQQHTSNHQQRPQFSQSSTYQKHQHSDYQQQGQFSQHTKAVTEESKVFFKSAFVSSDYVIKSSQSFSFKLIKSLLIIGFIMLGILLASIIPVEISYIGTSKSSVIISIIVGIILFLAIIIGATYAMTRLVVRQPITFKKVLSDFVLINSVSVAILVLSIILMLANAYRFGASVTLLSLLLFIISGIYMMAKYSTNNDTRISSFYGMIIYIIIIFLFISIFGESLFNQIFDNLLEHMSNY